MLRHALLSLVLLAATWLCYGQVLGHAFVNYDDPPYITENRHIRGGLTWQGVKWVFTAEHGGNWHPLTGLSHLLDVELFGLNAGGHHGTNLLLHALNALVLFGLLRHLTGSTWRSFLVAALFALHPVQVESVAWVSQRKTVLSGLFGMLALWGYARYVRASATGDWPCGPPLNAGRTRGRALVLYALTLLLLALGLMCKPVLVTWPVVMLLLDYWPLGREKRDGYVFSGAAPRTPATPKRTCPVFLGVFLGWPLRRPRSPRNGQSTLDKLPPLALCLTSSIITLLVQRSSGAVKSLEALPLEQRLSNALVAYARYLGKLFWPADLAVFYPHPGRWPAATVAGAAGLLVAITAIALYWRRRAPHLLVGWLWFVITMLPVIGLVQVGSQALADRYAYLSFIGLFIALAWSLPAGPGRGFRGRVAAGMVAAALLALGIATHRYAGIWRDSQSLFRHALASTHHNAMAHHNLGVALAAAGELDEAILHLRRAVELEPRHDRAHANLGLALARRGDSAAALTHLRRAVQLDPANPTARNLLGRWYLVAQQWDEARQHLEEAVRLDPHHAGAHYNLALALAAQGQRERAVAHLEQVLRLRPSDPEATQRLAELRAPLTPETAP